MTLRDAIDQYITWRRTHGAEFKAQTYLLKLFLKSVDGNLQCDAIATAQVRAFLTGEGPLTRYRAKKYSVLTGFYRYAVTRGFASCSPLPAPEDEPKPPPSAPRHVFSRDELRRLFGAIDVSRSRASKLDAHTFRTLLLLLYGTGLRLQEAMKLTLADVDLSDGVLNVRVSKFYKSRLVPVGPQLTDALRAYAAHRAERPAPEGRDSTFLANQDGAPLARRTVQTAFTDLLCAAGVRGAEASRAPSRQPPCLHSLRHSFAVHRLTAWYRQGADVQRLLPALSTYLGHASVAGTQVYLSMTPELLQQASLRFERYARGGDNE